MGWGRKETDMKYKDNHWKIPMKLQIFAGEGDDGGSEVGDGSGTNTGENNLMTFDEFLKLEGNQAEFDRRLQKATKTAVINAQEKWKTLTDDKLSEAEKLARMTKEEKAEYQTKKLEKELKDLKRLNALSDMSNTARKLLAENDINIPDELLAHLVNEDAESTKTAVDAFVKLYKDAVQAAVKDALKGKPPRVGNGSGSVTKEQILAIKNPSERQRMIAENITLFE